MTTSDSFTLELPVAPKRGTDLTGRDLSWFAGMVARGERGIFAEVCTITPAIAHGLLEKNDCNRSISQRYIDQTAMDIERGHYPVNGETVIVSRDGRLNDGQNRLLAIIKANKPIQTLVCFGVARESRMTVDQGRSRNASNYLAMKEVAYASTVASIASLHLAHKMGSYTRAEVAQRQTKQDVLAHYQKYAGQFDQAVTMFANNKWAKSTRSVIPLSVGFMVLRSIDIDSAEEFFNKLLSGANLARDNSILWCRERLSMMAKQSTGPAGASYVSGSARLEMILRHYNAWKERRKLSGHFKIRAGYPEIYKDKD